jgi:hypothetical protein
MAKKKELPKAMMGKVIKPVVRAVVSTGKVAGKAAVRGGKAYYKAVENAPTIEGPVSFVKAGGKGIKAAGKGFTRGVKSEIKVEKAKAAERALAEKTSKPVVDSSKKSSKNLSKSNTDKPVSNSEQKSAANKNSMTPEQKKKIKRIATVGTTAAAIGAYKYANRKRRTLND